MAAWWALSSLKLSRMASTELARVDRVVRSRTTTSSTLRETWRGDSEAVVLGRRNAKPIAQLAAALVQVHEAQHRFAQQLSRQMQGGAAPFRRDGARIDAGSAAKGREPGLDVAVEQHRGLLRANRGKRSRQTETRGGGGRRAAGARGRAPRFDFEGPGHHVPGRRRLFGERVRQPVRRCRLAVGIARTRRRIHVQLIARFQQLAQIEVGTQVIGGGLPDGGGVRMPVVGDDRILVGGEVVALVDADQQLVLAEADIISVLQRVVMVFTERYLRSVHIGAVRAGIDQDVGAGTKIDARVFARQVTLRVG